MAVTLSRIDRVYRHYDVTAKDADGDIAALPGVDVALLPPRTTPTAATLWTSATYAAGVATVLLAGPDADPASALVVPQAGVDLWLRVADNPEVMARRVERVTVT